MHWQVINGNLILIYFLILHGISAKLENMNPDMHKTFHYVLARANVPIHGQQHIRYIPPDIFCVIDFT